MSRAHRPPSLVVTRAAPVAPLTLLAAALGLAVGYALGDRRAAGDRDASGSRSGAESNSAVAYIASLQARIAKLEQQLERRTTTVEPVRREVGSAAPTSRPARPAPAEGRAPAVTAADPGRAAAVLAQISEALSRGDDDAIDELAPEIAAQRDLLAPGLAALLERADSLFEMEHLAELLGLAGDPRGVDSLTRLLERDTSDAVRTAAIRALGQIGDARAVGTLRAEFTRTGGSPMPPSLAATALGAIGNPEAIAALRTEITNGANRMVRTFALRALAELRDPSLGGFFADQATREDASDRYRVEAITALGETGDRSRIGQLEQIAFSPQWGRAVQEASKRALNRILGEARYRLR